MKEVYTPRYSGDKKHKERKVRSENSGADRRKQTPEVRNSHHLRPRSRGGSDNGYDPTNEIQMPMVRLHFPYHTLFAADRPHDVLSSILQRFETTNPHLEALLPYTSRERIAKRIRAWDKLFGGVSTRCGAAEVIIQHFVLHNRLEDKRLALREIDRAEQLGAIDRNEAEHLRNIVNR